MNLSDMISKMNPEMLSKGLKQISGMLTPEQTAQMEAAIKSMEKGELNNQINSLSAEDLKTELLNNPSLAKNLAKNPELVNKLADVIKNRRDNG